MVSFLDYARWVVEKMGQPISGVTSQPGMFTNLVGVAKTQKQSVHPKVRTQSPHLAVSSFRSSVNFEELFCQ